MEITCYLKYVDVLVGTLLIVGGLNWGLVGFFGFDVVAYFLGTMSIFSRALYAVIGLGALYEALQIRAIPRRWGCAWPKVAHGVAE